MIKLQRKAPKIVRLVYEVIKKMEEDKFIKTEASGVVLGYA